MQSMIEEAMEQLRQAAVTAGLPMPSDLSDHSAVAMHFFRVEREKFFAARDHADNTNPAGLALLLRQEELARAMGWAHYGLEKIKE
jgi:hypothetical protein